MSAQLYHNALFHTITLHYTTFRRYSRLSNRLYKPVWQPVWQQVVSCKGGFTSRHYVSPYQPMMHARLQHNVLFGSITSHYTAPQRLTISSHDVIHSYTITFYLLHGYRLLTGVKVRYSTR